MSKYGPRFDTAHARRRHARLDRDSVRNFIEHSIGPSTVRYDDEYSLTADINRALVEAEFAESMDAAYGENR